ncbi:hypothetical protein E4T43_06405 [Aureobasidium subglaciale]|nr:hypothetical protein E4T43_06405 [Aureobasidium subglaciale]
MVFARIVHFYSPTRKVWIFSPSILALIFVTLDTVSFVVQVVGSGMAGPGASALCTKEGLKHLHGRNWHAGRLHHPVPWLDHRVSPSVARDGSSGRCTDAYWQSDTIRIIYRLAEFSAGLGTNNPLLSNEPVLYVLESTPMWLAILMWNIVPEVQTPKCHLRGCRVISATAVANADVTTAV